MEITKERLAILQLLQEKGGSTSKGIKQETGLPAERVRREIEYLKHEDQLDCKKMVDGNFIGVKLTEEGRQTLRENKNLFKKTK